MLKKKRKEIIHFLSQDMAINGKARYVCNQAVFPTIHKYTTEHNLVTCKNCKKKKQDDFVDAIRGIIHTKYG